jgi:hypothetical protein
MKEPFKIHSLLFSAAEHGDFLNFKLSLPVSTD